MVIYGVAGILLLLFLVAPIRGLTLRRIEKVAPASIGFTISNRKEFSKPLAVAAFGTPLGTRATGLTSGPCVSADGRGLTFWDNTPLDLVGTLDWSRIAHLEVGDLQTRYRRWSSTAIFVHVTAGAGTVIVPLLSPNGTRRMTGSRAESEYLLAQLEGLRPTSITV